MTKKHPFLEKWLKENWTVGQYEPSPTFQIIPNHSCVCMHGDLGLIALTGSAEDLESQKQADLFASSPSMLNELLNLVNQAEQNPFLSIGMFLEHHSRIRQIIAKLQDDPHPDQTGATIPKEGK